MRAEQPVGEEEFPATLHCFADRKLAAGSLVFQQGLEREYRRVKRAVLRARTDGLTVPAAVSKLMSQQPIDSGGRPLVPASEIGRQQDHHGSDAGFRSANALGHRESPVEVLSTVPQLAAATQCLRMTARKPEPIQEQQSVGGGGPFRTVKGPRPSTVRVL